MPTTSSPTVFACHTEACRPPTAGGTGGSTPGVRATGFKIGGEMVFEFNDSGQRGFVVRAKDGTQLRAAFSVLDPPYGDDPRTDIDNGVHDGIAMEALTGLKLAYDLAPTRVTPGIVMGNWGEHPEVGGRLMFGFVSEHGGKRSPVARGKIGINISEDTYAYFLNDRRPSSLMPASRDVPLATYVAAHEFGHHRQFHGPDGQGHHTALKQLYTAAREDPDMSKYGKTNYLESGAEVFASWVLKGGNAETPLEQRYANRLEWGKRNAVVAAATAVQDYADVELIIDTFEGPSYVFKNGLRVNVKV